MEGPKGRGTQLEGEKLAQVGGERSQKKKSPRRPVAREEASGSEGAARESAGAPSLMSRLMGSLGSGLGSRSGARPSASAGGGSKAKRSGKGGGGEPERPRLARDRPSLAEGTPQPPPRAGPEQQ